MGAIAFNHCLKSKGKRNSIAELDVQRILVIYFQHFSAVSSSHSILMVFDIGMKNSFHRRKEIGMNI